MKPGSNIDLDTFKARFELVEKFAKDRKVPWRFGYFGPKSMIWHIGQESSLFFGSAYALWMQEAHPWISTGAHFHSNVREDPLGRWNNTFKFVNTMMMGNQGEAYKYSLLLHQIHTKVYGKLDNGKVYAANNSEAMHWVGATLAYTGIMCYENSVRKLTYREKNDYYQEFKNFYYMFGIDPDIVPEDWNDFLVYYNSVIYSGTLEVNDYARLMVSHFMDQTKILPKKLRFPSDLFLAYSTGLLPEHIREGYRLKYGFKQKLAFDLVSETIKTVYPRIPLKYRQNTYYIKAIEGKLV